LAARSPLIQDQQSLKGHFDRTPVAAITHGATRQIMDTQH